MGEVPPREPGEILAQASCGGCDHFRVDLRPAAQACPHRDPAAAPAKCDAPVRGGAEVVDQGAAVGDALAPGPADLLEQLGNGLGEDDVGGGDGEGVAQRRARRLRGTTDPGERPGGPNPAPTKLSLTPAPST